MLDDGNALSVGIFRDIRDVAVSMMKMWDLSFDELLKLRKLDEAIVGLDEWSRHPGHMVSKHEDLLHYPINEINRIASHLNLQCKEDMAREIIDEHTLEKNLEGVRDIAKQKSDSGIEGAYWDPKTLLHSNHIYSGDSGAWKEEPKNEQVRFLERKIGIWLEERGYSLSNNLENS